MEGLIFYDEDTILVDWENYDKAGTKTPVPKHYLRILYQAGVWVQYLKRENNLNNFDFNNYPGAEITTEKFKEFILNCKYGKINVASFLKPPNVAPPTVASDKDKYTSFNKHRLNWDTVPILKDDSKWIPFKDSLLRCCRTNDCSRIIDGSLNPNNLLKGSFNSLLWNKQRDALNEILHSKLQTPTVSSILNNTTIKEDPYKY